MLHCPDRSTLYAYLDGEVSPDLRHLLDVHARSCNSCRVHLEELSRVEGVLFDRPRTIEPVHFNQKFKERLLHRLSTGEEIRRSIRVGPGVTAAAAFLFLALGALIYSLWFDPILDFGQRGAAQSESAYAARANDRVRSGELAELQAGLWPVEKQLSVSLLAEFREYRKEFLQARMPLIAMAARLLDAQHPGLRQAAIQLLGQRRERVSSDHLRRFFQRDDAILGERNEALLAYVGSEGFKDVSSVLEELERGYGPQEAATVLTKLDVPRSWRALQALTEDHQGPNLRAILVAVSESTDHQADDLLRKVYLEGSQSQFLIDTLGERESTAPWARALLRGRRGRGKEIQGLIRLLGNIRDESSVALIRRRIQEVPLFDECVKALARIGSDAALDALVHQIDIGHANSQSVEEVRRSRVLAELIALRGGRDVDYFLEKARADRGRLGRRYLKAIAWAGGGIHVEALEKLAERDEYESACVDAIATISERPEFYGLAREALERLSESRDPSLRETAWRCLARTLRSP